MNRWQTRVEIPARTDGPGVARRSVDEALESWGLGHLSDDAELLVSELVTNALEHAPGPNFYELEISADERRVRIALADDSHSPPVMAEVAAGKRRGRGLWIVNVVASRWGAEDYPGGKRVWAEVPCQAAPT